MYFYVCFFLTEDTPAFGACKELLTAGGFVSSAIMSKVVFNYTLRVKGAIAKKYAASHGDLEIFNKSPQSLHCVVQEAAVWVEA